jgi:hypothetical protein
MQVRTPAEEDWGHQPNSAVPYWSSKENIWLDAGDGIIQSRDLTPDFKPNLIDPKSKTRFGMQEAPVLRTVPDPDLRTPLGPCNRGGNGPGRGPAPTAPTAPTAPHANVAVATLCTEVARQEAETAALHTKIARMEQELLLMRKILHGFIDLHLLYHDRGQI